MVHKQRVFLEEVGAQRRYRKVLRHFPRRKQPHLNIPVWMFRIVLPKRELLWKMAELSVYLLDLVYS